MRSFRIFIPVLILFLLSSSAFSQTNPEKKDTSVSELSNKRANKAALMSALVPGFGQAYNHKYWKLPILYCGFGFLIYLIGTNDKAYKDYRTAIKYRNDSDPLTIDNYPRFTAQDLVVRKDFYRRNRDLSIILTGVLYTLNIVDAYVDSQLLNFDVSDNLSIHSSPFLFQSNQSNTFAGIQFTLTLK